MHNNNNNKLLKSKKLTTHSKSRSLIPKTIAPTRTNSHARTHTHTHTHTNQAYEDLADPASKNKGQKRLLRISSPLSKPPKSAAGGGGAPFGYSAEGEPIEPKLIASLRRQLDEAHGTLRAKEEEIKRLQTSVQARELELTRTCRAPDSEGGVSHSMNEQLMAADAANKRIIDQLNSQVDFLNEQLALRETQLVESADKIIRADELQLECNAKTSMLDRLRSDNSALASQLRALEHKLAEVNEALDPEGSISVDDLYEISSQHSGSVGRFGNDHLAPPPPPTSSSLVHGHTSSSSSSSSFSSVDSQKRAVGRGTAAGAAASSSSSTGRAPLHPTTAAAASTRVHAYNQRSSVNASVDSNMAVQNNKRGSSASVYAKHAPYSSQQQHISDVVVSKLAVENSGYQVEVSRLSDTLSEMQAGDAIIKERMKRGEEKLASTKAELLEAKKQSDALARLLGQKQDEVTLLRNEAKDLHANLAEARQKLSSTSVSSVELSNQTMHTESLLSDALREKAQLEKMVDAMRSEMGAMRKEKIESTGSLSEIEALLQVAQNEAGLQKLNADKAREQHTTLREEYVKLQLQYDELEGEVQSARRQAEGGNRLLQETQSLLLAKNNELVEAKESVALLQMSATPSSINDQLRSDVKNLRAKCELLEEERREWVLEKRSLEQSVHSIAAQSQAQVQRSTSAQEDRAQLIAEIGRKENEITDLRRDVQQLEIELDRTKTSLLAQEKLAASLSSVTKEHQQQHQNHAKDAQQLSSDLQLMSRRLQDTQEAYSEARRQIDESNKSLARANDQHEAARREVASLNELLTASQRELERAEIQAEGLKRQLDAANRRAGSSSEDIQKAQAEKMALENKVHELKALIASIEASTRTNAIKSTRLAVALEEGEEGVRRMESEMHQLREVLADRENKLGDVQEALQSLDEERDKLQLQLDREQEQAGLREQARRHLEAQTAELRQVLARTEQKLQSAGSELTAAQRQCAATEARLSSMKEENNDLKRRINQKQAEAGGATEDLMLMTKENQALTAELAETAAERDRLSKRITEVMKAMATLEQARRAVDIEKADLLETYRSVLSEKRKLESELNALGAVKQRASVSVQQLQGQVAELRGVANSHASVESRWAAEKGALSRQLESMNDELVRSQRRIEALEADNRRMMQDTHSLRQTNEALNERVKMVVRRATAAADANKVLSSRLASVERERDAVRALVSVERQRAEDLSSMTEIQRTQIMASRAGGVKNAASSAPAPKQPPSSEGATSVISGLQSATLSSSLGLEDEEASSLY